MNLVTFCPYYPPHIGGLETHADEFNKHLSEKGMNITVFTPRLPENAPEFETKHHNVKIIRFPAFEIIPNYPLPKFWSARFWNMFRKIFKHEFDVVISRTRFFNTSLLALVYAKIKKTRWIHIEHGSDFVKSGGRISVFVAKIYDYTFGKLVFRTADKLIANSNASAAFCKKIAKNIECEVIYRGIEIQSILSAPTNPELNAQYPDKIKISFLGRLFDGKGVADLIKALAKIKEKNYICFIIGDGPEKKNLETLAKRLEIRDKIIFFGFKNFDEYVKILKTSDIFVNPSYTEGLPTTVAEAALCKNAIIATNVGGTKEIITDQRSGFLIEPKNIKELKNKLELLIGNPELLNQFSQNAYNKVVGKFSWDKSIEKYIDELGELDK